MIPPEGPSPAYTTAIYQGHDPDAGERGTDYLLVEYSDGSKELATRAGRDERWTTWSPPVALHVDERMPEASGGTL